MSNSGAIRSTDSSVLRLVTLAFAVAFLSACSSDRPPLYRPSPSAPVIPDPVTQTVGVAGGTINGPNGVTLTIPAGALATDTPITISIDSTGAPALPPNLTLVTDPIRLSPDGTKFGVPVTLSLPFDAARLQAGQTIALIKTTQRNDGWQQLFPNVSGNRLTAAITGFSGIRGVIGSELLPPQIGRHVSDSDPVIEGSYWEFGVEVLSYRPGLQYQWFRNGAALPNETNWTLRVGPAVLADNGASFTVRAYYPPSDVDPDGAESFSGPAVLNVLPGPPMFAEAGQPTPVVELLAGSSAQFTASATSSTALTQQWQSGRDDDDPATEIQWTDIPGATARTYATPPLQLADDGTLFRQVATNTVGSAISRVARVSVLAAPVFPSIASQPQWLAVQASEHAFFSVQAGGGGLSYAWERSSDGRNFQPIPDTDAPTFTLFNATLADDNSWFRVSARNSAGVVTSDAALLRVSLLPPARRRVSGGEQFSVGLHSDGSLRSWGQGHTWGALGDGTFEPRSDAVQVALIDDARAVSIGTRHSLVVRSNGEVWGWGKGLHGELGAAANEATPIRIASIILARAVAAGHGHFSPSDDRDDLSAYPSDFSLVASANGIVRAWGRNESGQLGDGTTNSRPDAQLVGTLSGVINVAAGSGHSLALRSDGSVYAWGRNEHGQLGDGQIAASLRPIPVAIPVAAPATVIEIVASGSTSYALDSRGDVWAWGNNSAGNVGDGTTADKPSPQLVPLPMPANSIAAGLNHAVALLLDGRVFAWGSNEFGECACGAQPTASANLPAHVANLPPDIVAIGAGTAHSLALDADGNVWGWGRNDTFQLNDGTSLNRGQPVMVNNVNLNGADVAPPHLTNRIAAGAAHSLALRDGAVSGGMVFSWGSDQEGQLGSGPGQEDRNRPAVIASPNRVRAVAAGDLHSLAVLENGDVWGWGWNDQGALGEIEESVFIETPGRIPDVSGVRTACGGGLHSIFLLEDGTLLALGANANGQLGAGSTAQNSITALRVTGLEGVTAIACGRNHSLALMSDNTVRAWGRNHRGQLGNGSFDDQPVRSPVAVSNLTDVVAIAAGHNHSLALLRNGSVWAWGSNERGQLGDGTTEMRLLPVPALAAGRFVQLAGGPEFSVALRAGGGVVAWGDNQSAQLGIGGQEPAFSAEPVEPSIPNVIEIRAGNSHVLAVRADLSLWAWGANHFGQLGAGSTVDVIPSPVVLPDLAP